MFNGILKLKFWACSVAWKNILNKVHIVQWGDRPKIWLVHKFWLEGPIDVRPTAFCKIFSGTPHLTIFLCAQIWAKKCIFGIFGNLTHILLGRVRTLLEWWASEQKVEWMVDGWVMGDTPLTVTTTRAHAVLKNNFFFSASLNHCSKCLETYPIFFPWWKLLQRSL